jgi:hypothetical protein
VRHQHPVILVALLAFGGSSGALSPVRAVAQSAHSEANSEVSPPDLKAALEAQSSALRAQHSRDDIANRVVLPAVAAQRQMMPPASKDAPQQVGFRRSISLDDANQVAAARLQWKPIGSGTVAAFSITSPDAAALRVAVEFRSLPNGTEIRFFSLGPDRRVYGPFVSMDIRAAEVNHGAGGPSVFWSPVIEGDTAGVEIFVPAAGRQEDVGYTLRAVSHLVASPTDKEAFLDKASGFCEVNVACYSTSWGSTANAVAKILFTVDGSTYLCTGTLLTDTDPSTYRPYFLTANHCVSTSSAASTVNSWWFYQSTCSGTKGSARQLYRGATLLATSASNDFTFLVLNDPTPAGATLAGWTTVDPVGGASAAGIHHPVGDVKKISFGTVDGISSLGYLGSILGSGPFHRTSWTQGVTEPGSSGSALFNAAQQVVGQLYGGYSSCFDPAAPDYYGRFSLTYPLIRQWLAAPAVSLTSSVAFPVTAGASVTWSAAGSGGTSPHTYQFWLFDGSAWSMVRDWSASNTWTWMPAWPGSYSVQVWMRNAGSSSSYDAFASAAASITIPRALTITAVTPSAPSVAAGTSVTWTAVALGGTAPYTFQFWVYDGAQWSLAQDWSSASTWSWTPPTPGTYSFQVWTRNAGSGASYDTYRTFGPYTATRPSSITATSLRPSVVGPVPAGTPVTWTAVAAGGTAPYTYKFWVWDGSAWSIGRDWSSGNTWRWIPPMTGHYSFQVWVRNASSVSNYDGWRASSTYAVGSPASLAVMSLSADRTWPVPAGTPVKWTATAVGGTGPYTFRFFVYNGSTWTVGQEWSSADTWTWIPSAAGAYLVQVWVRSAGSLSTYDQWLGAPPAAIGAAVPIQTPTLTSSPMAPLVANSPVVLTATTSAGTAPYTYQFWVHNGTTWSLGRDWAAANTWTWVPSAAGTYSIQVWIRNVGSGADVDAWRGLGPITVVP